MSHSSSTSADRKPHPSSNGKYKPLEDVDAAKAITRLIDGKRISKSTRESLSHSRPEWLDVVECVESSEGLDPQQKRSFVKRWLENISLRKPNAWRPIRNALEACWGETVEDEPDDEKPGRKPFTLDVLDSATFLANEYTLSWLVRGVLVKGQPCVIGGPKKTLKTSLLIDLAVSLATATKFLGKFTVDQPVRVGFFSGESGPATIKDTVLRVCASKGADPADLGHVTWGFKLPQLSHQEHLDELARVIHERQLEVVMVDPLYLCLLAGSPGRRLDPANLFDMGPLLMNVTEACLSEGATPAFSHHFKKNRESPYDTPELEDLAFAGIQEFARQWLLVGRREKYEPGSGLHRLWFTVGGSAGHSGDWAIDVDEGVMDDDFHGRHRRPVRPARLGDDLRALRSRNRLQGDDGMSDERVEFIAGDAASPPSGFVLRRLPYKPPVARTSEGLRDAYHCHVCKGWVVASPIRHWVEGRRSDSGGSRPLGCESTCVRCHAVIGWSDWVPVYHTAEGGKAT